MNNVEVNQFLETQKEQIKFVSTKWNSIFYANEVDLLGNDVIYTRYAAF